MSFFLLFSCKKNKSECADSKNVYYNARMAQTVDFMFLDSKGKDVFKSGYFDLDNLRLHTFEGDTEESVGYEHRLDSTESFYTISMIDVSYTREGYPLVLDFGTGRKDTLVLKEIGFNSCTGPINEVGKSSGIKEINWNKIILDI